MCIGVLIPVLGLVCGDICSESLVRGLLYQICKMRVKVRGLHVASLITICYNVAKINHSRNMDAPTQVNQQGDIDQRYATLSNRMARLPATPHPRVGCDLYCVA